MLLETRNSSNTALNLMRNPRCSLNFVPHDKKYMRECVRLGFPGDTTEEKMKDCPFTRTQGIRKSEDPDGEYPEIIDESFQVFECSWDSSLEAADRQIACNKEPSTEDGGFPPPYNDFNGITSEFGAHFILKVERILMRPQYADSIINGVQAGGFPRVPVDYGYRDNSNFWLSAFRRPYREKIPAKKGTEAQTVFYAANRIDPDISFSMEACEKLVQVPRIFLNTALKGCVQWAKEHDVAELTPEHMDQIRDKRSRDK